MPHRNTRGRWGRELQGLAERAARGFGLTRCSRPVPRPLRPPSPASARFRTPPAQTAPRASGEARRAGGAQLWRKASAGQGAGKGRAGQRGPLTLSTSAGPSISASATPSAPPQPSGRARGRRDVRTQRGAEADGPRPQARAARGRHVVTLTLPSHAASGMAALAGGKVCQPKLSVGREGWLESRIPALGRRGGVGGRGSP